MGKVSSQTHPVTYKDITTSESTFKHISRNRHNYRFVIWYCGITKKSGHW